SFTIKGVTKTPLACEPEVLNFDPEEVQSGLEKEVTLRENGIRLDWSRVAVASADPHLRVLRKSTDGQSARFAVKCQVPEGLESLQCTFSIGCRVSESAPSRAGSPV